MTPRWKKIRHFWGCYCRFCGGRVCCDFCFEGGCYIICREILCAVFFFPLVRCYDGGWCSPHVELDSNVTHIFLGSPRNFGKKVDDLFDPDIFSGAMFVSFVGRVGGDFWLETHGKFALQVIQWRSWDLASNISPENWWLEDEEFPFKWMIFRLLGRQRCRGCFYSQVFLLCWGFPEKTSWGERKGVWGGLGEYLKSRSITGNDLELPPGF